jgi:tetratricopeptide (TPR) repeat protein
MFVFPLINPIIYYFLVYRASPAGVSTRGFELPGSHDRRRVKELEAQIHHIGNAHHYLQLGDVYFQMGKLEKAETAYRESLKLDATDIDARAHLGQCLLRQKKAAEARPWLEQVCAENPKHDFGHSLMALAETLTALNEREAAIKVWQRVLEHNSYARARVQLAELYLTTNQVEQARAELKEVLADDAHAPVFQRKRDKVWVRRAKRLLR